MTDRAETMADRMSLLQAEVAELAERVAALTELAHELEGRAAVPGVTA